MMDSQQKEDVPLVSGKHYVHPSENKISKKLSLKKKTSTAQMVDDFTMKLRQFTEEELDRVYNEDQLYFIEDNWSTIIHDDYFTARMKEQQAVIWEMIKTESNYICRMKLILMVFQQIFRIAQREGELTNIKREEIFANIDQVFLANDEIWKKYFIEIVKKARIKRGPIKPSELLAPFHMVEELYKPYVEFFLKQESCLNRIRDYSDPNKESCDKMFRAYLNFCENLPQCRRYELVSLMTEPMQRITRYPLLMQSIKKATDNVKEKEQLEILIQKMGSFIRKINTRIRKIDETKALNKVLDEFEDYNTWSAGNEDVLWPCVDFLRGDIEHLPTREQRCYLTREKVKILDKKGKSEMNIEMILFTDVIVFSRRRSSSKKLVVAKQLHFLDKVQFHKSEVSATSLVVIYLDEYGMLANSMMIEMTEESRDVWIEAVSKAQDRYEKAKSGTGSTLEFFQDSRGINDDEIHGIKPPRKTSELINSVEVTRRSSVSVNNAKNTEKYTEKSIEKKDEKNTAPELPPKTRKTSTASNGQEKSPKSPVKSYDNRAQDLEEDTPGLNRRSASWLLTDEKRVKSIRCLLREDLWGAGRPKVRSSSSFRSDISDSECENTGDYRDSPDVCSLSSVDSGPQMTSDNQSDLSRNNSRKNLLKPNNTKLNLNSPTDNNEARKSPCRKVSSSSTGLPEIAEHIYAEITFMSRDQVTDKNQRRSLKSDSNNNLKTPSPKTKVKVDKPFEDVFTDSSGSSLNGDYVDDYLENN
ncbi:pleckstrin homology domain-containing family G member 5-like isoform X2 [Clytia hemisphaerica]|uniref:DH domain-containing protein n=1 Tax=Clytia hemisphaerica TaxID=252671 RepID=A0A7M5WTR8_9CNID